MVLELDPERINVNGVQWQLDILWVQQTRIEDLSSGENSVRLHDIIGDKSSHGREGLVGRMGVIKKTKGSANSSGATSSLNNTSQTAMEELKSKLRDEVRNEIREELEGLQQFKAFVLEKLSALGVHDAAVDVHPAPSNARE